MIATYPHQSLRPQRRQHGVLIDCGLSPSITRFPHIAIVGMDRIF